MAMDISNLRSKLREAGNKEYIEAVWEIGFKLAEGKQKITQGFLCSYRYQNLEGDVHYDENDQKYMQ